MHILSSPSKLQRVRQAIDVGKPAARAAGHPPVVKRKKSTKAPDRPGRGFFSNITAVPTWAAGQESKGTVFDFQSLERPAGACPQRGRWSRGAGKRRNTAVRAAKPTSFCNAQHTGACSNATATAAAEMYAAPAGLTPIDRVEGGSRVSRRSSTSSQSLRERQSGGNGLTQEQTCLESAAPGGC